jgi:hypothetical protein
MASSRSPVGSKAIGPADAEQAHRIWESIEYESQTIEQQIEAIVQRDFDTPFQRLVQGVTLTEQGEVAEACGAPGPLLFTRERPEHEGLARLSPARQFVESLRSADLVARYGGDEFVVVLPGCGRDLAAKVASRIGQRARSSGLSLSVGVASWLTLAVPPRRLRNPHWLLRLPHS